MLMQAAEDLIKGIITDVIEFILMSQAAGAVLSFFTFGATEVAAAADAAKVAEETVKTEKEVKKVSDLLDETASVWEKIGAKFLDHKGGEAMQKMVDAKPGVTKVTTQQGIKNILKDSAKDQGLRTVGYKTGGKKSDVTSSVTGTANKSTQPGQGAQYGTTGDDSSDHDIDQDL